MLVDPMFCEGTFLLCIQGPLVHILLTEMNELLKTIMKRFLRATTVDSKSGGALLALDLQEKSDHLYVSMEVGVTIAIFIKIKSI